MKNKQEIIEEFDERIIAIRKGAKENPSHGMEELIPCFEKDHEAIKNFILKTIKKTILGIIGEEENTASNVLQAGNERSYDAYLREEGKNQKRQEIIKKAEELNLI